MSRTQLVKYGEHDTAPKLFYCEKGKECKKYISENRECVTIHPFISLDGCITLCHVILRVNR